MAGNEQLGRSLSTIAIREGLNGSGLLSVCIISSKFWDMVVVVVLVIIILNMFVVVGGVVVGGGGGGLYVHDCFRNKGLLESATAGKTYG